MHTDYRKRHSMLAKYRSKLKPTKYEWSMFSKLKKWGIRSQFNKPTYSKTIPAANFIVDFYLPNPHYTVLEIDGGYHFTKEGIKRDEWKNLYLTKHRNMRVIRIKNESVWKMTKEKLLKTINNMKRGEVAKL